MFSTGRKYTEPPNRCRIAEVKNILEGMKSRLNDTKEWISELEDSSGDN